MAPTSSGWLSHGAASLFATAHAPAKNPAARSAAERAEREADQMRPCTPLTFAPAPRESAFKPVPHPAAPVGRSSQTRRHHLSSTPVQQLCTDVQSCDQKRFFSYTGRGAFSFGARPKGAPAAPRAVGRGGARERAQFSPQAETELSGLCDDDNGGRIPAGQAPLREQNPPRPPPGGPTVFRRVSASGPPGSSPPCGCGAVFPNSPRLLPGRQTNRPRPPPGGQGPCNGRFTSCRAVPSCASRGPEWPCASAGSWG